MHPRQRQVGLSTQPSLPRNLPVEMLKCLEERCLEEQEREPYISLQITGLADRPVFIDEQHLRVSLE